MAMAAVVAGLGAVSAISSIQQGKAEAKSLKRQGDYNAQVYEQQAEMMSQQAKLQEYQDNRNAAKIRGATMARTGKNGFEMGGSPLAIMVDNETQMELDKQVGQYNYEVQQSVLRTQASFTRYEYNQQAKLAKTKGYSNAFKILLGTAAQAMAGSGGGSSGAMKGASSGSGTGYTSPGQTYSSYTYTGGV
jgi:hypothetical protein